MALTITLIYYRHYNRYYIFTYFDIFSTASAFKSIFLESIFSEYIRRSLEQQTVRGYA